MTDFQILRYGDVVKLLSGCWVQTFSTTFQHIEYSLLFSGVLQRVDKIWLIPLIQGMIYQFLNDIDKG